MKFNQTNLLSKFALFYKTLGLKFTDSHRKNLGFLIKSLENDLTINDVRWSAYIFATIFWETGKTLAPVQEFRAKEGTNLRKIQDRYWDTNYFGRGYVQITWEKNYKIFNNLLKLPLLENPELALNPEISWKIASVGMVQGLFTGKKLSDYLNNQKTDYVNARRIINGTDKADIIAKYAKDIEIILTECLLTNQKPKQVVQSIVEEDSEVIDIIKNTEIPSTSPDAKPIIIEAVKAIKPQGLSSWRATLTSVLGSVTATIASLWQWISDPNNGKIFLIGGIVILCLGFISLIIYLILRHKRVMLEEQKAHELTIHQMNLRANPETYNVEVSQ